ADESIRSASDARAAIELEACRIVNIKQGRVGGLLEAKRVHDVASQLGVPGWCGGMLETGGGGSTSAEPPAGRAPDFPAAGSHERDVAVLRRGPDRAARPGARRDVAGPRRTRDRRRTRPGTTREIGRASWRGGGE